MTQETSQQHSNFQLPGDFNTVTLTLYPLSRLRPTLPLISGAPALSNNPKLLPLAATMYGERIKLLMATKIDNVPRGNTGGCRERKDKTMAKTSSRQTRQTAYTQQAEGGVANDKRID